MSYMSAIESQHTSADPSGAFLFRFESPRFVESIRPGLAGKLQARVPVVYRLNLRDSSGYFLAQRFVMRDKDVILIADAEGSQLLKFFTLLRGVTAVISLLQKGAGTTAPTGAF